MNKVDALFVALDLVALGGVLSKHCGHCAFEIFLRHFRHVVDFQFDLRDGNRRGLQKSVVYVIHVRGFVLAAVLFAHQPRRKPRQRLDERHEQRRSNQVEKHVKQRHLHLRLARHLVYDCRALGVGARAQRRDNSRNARAYVGSEYYKQSAAHRNNARARHGDKYSRHCGGRLEQRGTNNADKY